MRRHYVILAAIVFLLLVAFDSLFIVNQTEQAIVIRLGQAVANRSQPGLKAKIPFLERILFFDKRKLNIDIRLDPEEVIALDRKRVIVDAYAKYIIVDPLLFYKTVGNERGLMIAFNPIMDSAIREAVGRVNLIELLSSKRAMVMQNIMAIANDRAKRFGINVVDVRIRRTDLPQSNSASIYRRMQTGHEKEAQKTRAEGAEQAQRIRAEAERDREILLAEAEKDAQIVRGRAEAKATLRYAQAYGKNADFYAFYRSMQAYQKTLKTDDTTMIISPSEPFFKYLNQGAGK
ncbi:MAG: protease modulator HflC [Alphaproteobacteria bacterium]|nr:protease modulator HflC [Alphaproteobacteria bacterium]